MKYFCCGLPRTGTQSLVTVAKMMGLRTSHPRQGGIIAYDEADFFADTPIWSDWRELASQFPDARFILSYRHEDMWVRSFYNVLGSYTRLMLSGQVQPVGPEDERSIHLRCYKKVFKSAVYINHERLREIYREHNKEVATYFSDYGREKYLPIDITLPNALPILTEWMGLPVVNFPKVR